MNPYAALTADVPSVDPTASPSTSAATPSPSAPPAATGNKSAGIAVVVLFVAVAVLAMMWIRRAAARYRRRIHDDN